MLETVTRSARAVVDAGSTACCAVVAAVCRAPLDAVGAAVAFAAVGGSDTLAAGGAVGVVAPVGGVLSAASSAFSGDGVVDTSFAAACVVGASVCVLFAAASLAGDAFG